MRGQSLVDVCTHLIPIQTSPSATSNLIKITGLVPENLIETDESYYCRAYHDPQKLQQ